MEVNIPLLRKVVEWVESQEALAFSKDRRWYQGAWFRKDRDADQAVQDRNDPMCGTAMCVAGKVAFDAGWKPVYVDHGGEYLYADDATKGGVTKPIEEIAAAELGLPWEVADELFGADNTAEHIREIAEHIAGEAL